MIRKVALLLSLSVMTSCATPSLPPVEQPKPKAADPRVCAPVRRPPPLPAGASIVAPVTAQARAATEAFLSWVADLVDVADINSDRAEMARDEACED